MKNATTTLPENKADSGSSRLSEILRGRGRLSLEDRQQCALNLGLFAERLNRQNPLAGAREIVERAGEDIAKRQRWITLPGEQPAGTLGSTGATWLRLAVAAASLTSGAGEEEGAGERAVHQLLKGTSFLPVYAPESTDAADRKKLADSYALRVAKCIYDDGALGKLWSVLEEFPFSVGSNRDTVAVSPADRVPQDWIETQYTPGNWSFSVGERDDWSRPRLDVGCLVFDRLTKVFMLPEDIAQGFRNACLDENGENLSDEVLDRMKAAGVRLGKTSAYGILNYALPETEFDAGTGFGWREAHAFQLVRVRLKIVPDADHRPRLVADFFHDEAMTIIDVPGMSADGYPYHSEGAAGWLELQVQNRNLAQTFQSTDFRFVGQDELMARIVFAEPVNPYADSDPVPVGLMDPDFPWELPRHFEQDTDTVMDWCDTTDWATSLLTSKYRFVPSFDISSRENPFPKGSVMHALFSNLSVGDPARRVDQMLRVHARRTAEIGLSWYGQLVDEAHLALETIR